MVLSHSYCIILFVSCLRGVGRGGASATVTALSCLFHVKEVSVGDGPQPQLLHYFGCFSVGDGPQPQLLHYLVCFMSKRCQ